MTNSNKPPDAPFDPPRPPDDDPLATAGHIVAVAGLVVADVATGGLLRALASLPGGRSDAAIDPDYVAELARTTAPPRAHGDGSFACTGCEAAVAFADLSINEHGYFCAACAAPGQR